MNIKLNPVFRKELKLTTRTWKIAMTIFAYLGVLTFIGLFVFYQLVEDLEYTMSYREFTNLYIFISFFQFGLLLFIVPALTAGTISGERERQTLEILLSTPLKPWRILMGKLISAISTILLLVVASMPILSLVFIFGGVSIWQLIGLIGYYIVTAIYIGSIGVLLSTIFKRTTASNVVAYAIVLLLTLGTIIFSMFYLFYLSRKGNYSIMNTPLPVPLYILYANPLTGFVTVLVDQLGGGNNLSEILFYDLGNQLKRTLTINIMVEMVMAILCIGIGALRLNPNKGKFFRKKKRA